MIQRDKMTEELVLLINPWHEMMFINSTGMLIPETALYVMFSNTCALLVTQSLLYEKHR